MAYKFQLGAFTASGSLTADGFDAADENISNVGTIKLDTITVDDGATEIDIIMADSDAAALEIKEAGGTEYLKFDTSAALIYQYQNARLDGSKQVQFRSADNQVGSPGVGQLELKAGGSLKFNANSGNRATMTDSALELEGIKLKYNANMEAGKLLVSDGTDFESVAMSGDVNIASSGATTIQAAAVESGMLNNNVISGQTAIGATADQADELMISDGGVLKKITVSNLEDTVFGNISGDATVAAGGAMTMAAAQTNITSLLATDIKIGEDDQTKIDFETADEIHFYAANAEQVYVADGIFGPQTDSDVDLGSTGVRWKNAFMDALTVTNDVTIAGDLVVQGSTVTLDVTNVGITGSFIFEGATADGNELTLGVVDPTADRSVNIADSAGTLVPFAAVPAAGVQITSTPAELNKLDGATCVTADFNVIAGCAGNGLVVADLTKLAAVDASAAEINLLDAAAGSSVAVAAGDGVIIFDASDSNNGKKVLMSDLKSFIAGGTDVALKANGNVLDNGVNYFASSSAAEISASLPASPAVGDSIKIKAMENCGASRLLTIERAGSHTIDGATSIQLKSPHAAVECVYVAANLWKVF